MIYYNYLHFNWSLRIIWFWTQKTKLVKDIIDIIIYILIDHQEYYIFEHRLVIFMLQRWTNFGYLHNYSSIKHLLVLYISITNHNITLSEYSHNNDKKKHISYSIMMQFYQQLKWRSEFFMFSPCKFYDSVILNE